MQNYQVEDFKTTAFVSGMNSMEMLKENIKAASIAKAGDFTEDDFDIIAKAKMLFWKL